jgi:hypothetical protein
VLRYMGALGRRLSLRRRLRRDGWRVAAGSAGSWCASGGVALAAGAGAWPMCSAGRICATNIASGRGTRGVDLPCTACAPTATLIG